MITIKILVNVFTAFLDIIAIGFIVGIISGSKKGQLKIRLAIVTLHIIISVLWNLYFVDKIFSVIGTIIMGFFLSLTYKEAGIKKFFALILACLLVVLAEVIIVMISVAINDISVEELQNDIVLYAQCAIISKLIVIVIAYNLSFVIKPKDIVIADTNAFLFWLLPISSFFVIYVQSVFVFNVNNHRYKILALVSSVILLISNVILTLIFDYVLKEKNKRSTLELEKLQLEYERKYYIDLNEKQGVSNKNMHDIKNKLFAFNVLIKTDLDAAIAKIDEICDFVNKVQQLKITGIVSIDALLNTKFEQIKEEKFNLNKRIYITSTNSFDEFDLCVILGNIFDNAIEASQKYYSNNADSAIDIEFDMEQRERYLFISLVNPTINKLEEGKALLTTKENKLLHGYGLKNVKEIVEKYDGEMSTTINEGLFEIKILLKDRK